MDISPFLELAEIFEANGFKLFMVGGTSRDYLRGSSTKDFDLTTDATPDDERKFLPNANFCFAKYGCVKLKIEDFDIEITTLRIEGEYKDFRHPSFIKYVNSTELDYKRRDFTCNAIYIDKDLKTYDYCGGINDLNDKVLRFIGDPKTRVYEDPLRILRAKRFAKKLGFEIEKNTLEAIENNEFLLNKLNPEKVKEEIKKDR